MTDPQAPDPHAIDVPGHGAHAGSDHHDAADHGDADGHDHHAHGDEALGPVDVAAWGAGVLGVAVAVVIAVCFALATSGIG
jgi:hypothetical protein